jgi:hypothetical protein
MTGTRWIGLGGIRRVDTRHETWLGKRSGVDPRPVWLCGHKKSGADFLGLIMIKIIFVQKIQDDRVIYVDCQCEHHIRNSETYIEMNAFR